MLRVLCIVLMMFLSSCSDDNKSPIAQDDHDQILNEFPQDKGNDSVAVNGIGAVVKISSISGKGILWKPISDSNKKLVVLLKRSYGKPSIAVYIKSGNTYKFKENGSFKYYSNPDRATYGFSYPGRSYGTCVLRVGNSFYYVPNGANRYE